MLYKWIVPIYVFFFRIDGLFFYLIILDLKIYGYRHLSKSFGVNTQGQKLGNLIMFHPRPSSFKKLLYIRDGDHNGVIHYAGTSYGEHPWMNPILAKVLWGSLWYMFIHTINLSSMQMFNWSNHSNKKMSSVKFYHRSHSLFISKFPFIKIYTREGCQKNIISSIS